MKQSKIQLAIAYLEKFNYQIRPDLSTKRKVFLCKSARWNGEKLLTMNRLKGMAESHHRDVERYALSLPQED
tara:strand:+ start:519 stop:734 length:216 start_codon:yes stop_codon:yes gene_type:complete